MDEKPNNKIESYIYKSIANKALRAGKRQRKINYKVGLWRRIKFKFQVLLADQDHVYLRCYR